MKLDLGCGMTPRDGYTGVDLPPDRERPTRLDELSSPPLVRPGVLGIDLAEGWPWPFADDSIEALASSHLIEHLPACTVVAYDWKDGALVRVGRRDILCRFMDEAWRVAKVGAEFLLRWPAIIDASTGLPCKEAFQDPTHYRFIPEATMFSHFSRAGRVANGISHYPIACNWRMVHAVQRRIGDDILALRILESEVLLVKEP